MKNTYACQDAYKEIDRLNEIIKSFNYYCISKITDRQVRCMNIMLSMYPKQLFKMVQEFIEKEYESTIARDPLDLERLGDPEEASEYNDYHAKS